MEGLKETIKFWERKTLKSYSHLDPLVVPDEYSLCTRGILFYPDHGFETMTPIGKFMTDSAARLRFDPGKIPEFLDPERLTYFSWIQRQEEQESHAERLFRDQEERLAEGSCEAPEESLVGLISASRFIYHGFQMLAAYCGQMARSGEAVVCFLFQAANDMQKIQALAYQLGLFRKYHGGLSGELFTPSVWESHSTFQPLRKLLEELLCEEDWTALFVILNTVVKPACDQLILKELPGFLEAKRQPDPAAMLRGLRVHQLWQEKWTGALLSLMQAASPDCSGKVSELQADVGKKTDAALMVIRSLFDREGTRKYG